MDHISVVIGESLNSNGSCACKLREVTMPELVEHACALEFDRLADTLPSGEVESAIRRLHSVAEGLQSSDSVDEACIAEFMSVFHTSLNGRIHGLPTPPDDQR